MNVRARFALTSAVVLAGCGSLCLQSALPVSASSSAFRFGSPLQVASYAQGMNFLKAHQYNSAIRAFSLSIKAHQHIPESYAGTGFAYMAERKYKPAEAAYQAAAKLRPTNTDYVYKTGLAALYAADNNTAIAWATRFIHLEPKSFNGYHLRFLASNQGAQRKRLIPDAQMEVKLRPHSAAAYSDLGIAWGQNGKNGPSIKAFSQAIHLDPRNYEFYVNRAVVENLDHQPQAALRDLQTARGLAPAPARKNIDHAIASLKQYIKTHK